MKNILTLHKDAYLFHSSKSNFAYGRKALEQNRKIQKLLQDPETYAREHEYMLSEGGQPIITVDGENIYIHDHMIQTVTGEYNGADIVNNRQCRLFESAPKGWKYYGPANRETDWICSEKFKSLSFSAYPDGLQYYRINFRYNRIDFIVSGGKFYEVIGGMYSYRTETEIFRRLDAGSDKVRKEIGKILEGLK